MDTAHEQTADDILTCPKCGRKTMYIYVEENETLSVRCANCRDLVAFSSELIRILGKT